MDIKWTELEGVGGCAIGRGTFPDGSSVVVLELNTVPVSNPSADVSVRQFAFRPEAWDQLVAYARDSI